MATNSAAGIKWDLSDLFAGHDDPQIEKTLTECHIRADAFSKRFRTPMGRPETLTGSAPGFVALDFDERGPGFPRLFGQRLDIGAYEIQTDYTVRFVHIERTPTGMLLRVQCEANGPLTIEWNADPKSTGWQPLATGTADASGRLQYTDTAVAGASQRFYRAVRP